MYVDFLFVHSSRGAIVKTDIDIMYNMENTTPVKKKRSIKQRMIDASHSKYGMYFLYFISFIDSAFFPIPPDILVIPMVVSRPKTWKKIGIMVSIFSVAGSFLGYFIGFVLFESVGEAIIETYDLSDEMVKLGAVYNKNALWSLFIGAFTPLPYKVFTIAAGVFKINIWTFALASLVGRTMRYMLVAYLAHIGGVCDWKGYIKSFFKWKVWSYLCGKKDV